MKIFISGGCKNGKSTFAQQLAAAQRTGQLFYIATMLPHDHEDDERILRHQKEREGWGFQTIEQPTQIEDILRYDHSGSYLLDSLTALLANEMFLPDGTIVHHAYQKIISGMTKLLSQIDDIVIVSDYIYSDAFRYDPLTEEYRFALASIDKAVAALCDTVIEVSFTSRILHKGTLPKETFHV